MRKLTKREAIDLHKEMWNFIVKNSKEKDSDSLEFSDERTDLKRKFIQIALPGEEVLNNCFICEYANQQLQKYYKKNSDKFDVDGNYCKYCLIDWCKFCTKENRDHRCREQKDYGFLCECEVYDYDEDGNFIFRPLSWLYSDAKIIRDIVDKRSKNENSKNI